VIKERLGLIAARMSCCFLWRNHELLVSYL